MIRRRILAPRSKHAAVVKLLLEKGAELESKDKGDWSALRYAAVREDEAMVMLLLEKGARLESKDKNGLAALSYAVMLNLMFEKGTYLDSTDMDGWDAATICSKILAEGGAYQ